MTIIAGTDGADWGMTAVEWAAAEAQRRRTPLRILHALDWDWHESRTVAAAGRPGAGVLVQRQLTGPVDTAALESLLLRLGRLAEDLPEVAELDLNPVLAGPEGVVAVDAKLRLAPVGAEPDPLLRRLSAAEPLGKEQPCPLAGSS